MTVLNAEVEALGGFTDLPHAGPIRGASKLELELISNWRLGRESDEKKLTHHLPPGMGLTTKHEKG